MLVQLLAMHIFSIKVLIFSLLQYGTIRLMYASDPDLAYLTENMKTDLSFYDKAELNAFYQCTGMVIYHLSHICLKKNLVEFTRFFFIIMTFEEMSTFLTCSEQLDQIKLNLLERVPTVAISTFFENKL